MPTIKDSLYFTYDGVSCKTFNLVNINLSNGMFEEQFVAERSINELKVKGNDKPLFHGLEEEPLEFEMTIAFEKPFTDSDIDNIILWLFQDNYKPLFFEDKPNKVYYCMPVGEPMLAHTGLREGYFTINMRCNSSKIYSPLQTTPTYNLSTNTGTYNVSLVNNGHVEIHPEISIEKVGNGDITFTREDGEIFEIRGLANGEKLYINCEKEIIETDIVGVYRYENVIGDYHDMGLKVGTTKFGITGKCKVTFRYSYKYKF